MCFLLLRDSVKGATTITCQLCKEFPIQNQFVLNGFFSTWEIMHSPQIDSLGQRDTITNWCFLALLISLQKMQSVLKNSRLCPNNIYSLFHFQFHWLANSASYLFLAVSSSLIFRVGTSIHFLAMANYCKGTNWFGSKWTSKTALRLR